MMNSDQTLSLYLHIPFCVRKCLYCDFLSAPGSDAEVEHYLGLLEREVVAWGKILGKRAVKTVFLGGGTPSLLTVGQTGRLIECIRKSFLLRENAEITIEVNPGTVTREKLLSYHELGINRLSIGLQSMNDEELKRLGRIHTSADFRDTYQMAREVGFANINVDLMSALPGQDLETWENTLGEVLRLRPEHISAYSLILEEGTPLFEMQDQLIFPGEDLDREMYERTEILLKEYGYHRYEISNYALDGLECEHNKVYWTGGEYLGLGLGASTLLGTQRFRNPAVHGIYEGYVKLLEQESDFPIEGSLSKFIYNWEEYLEIEELSVEDQMAEFMFLGLRLTEGISLGQFEMIFGRSLNQVYGDVLKKLEQDGLLTRTDNGWKLTERGIDVSNYVFAMFLPD